MGRHILTFLFVLFGMMLLMRACAPKTEGPPATPLVRVTAPDADTLVTIRNEEQDLTVRLDRTGAIVSVQKGSQTIVRPVQDSYRTFNLMLLVGDSRNAVSREGWEVLDVPNGHEFHYRKDGFSIRKRILLRDDGAGLDLELEITGAPDDAHGFVLTGASGVMLPGTGSESEDEGQAFWEMGEAALWHRSHSLLVQYQERLRDRFVRLQAEGKPASRRFHTREKVEGVVRRFGVMGESHYVALHDLPDAAALSVEAYRAARRGDVQSRELETWLELQTVQKGYAGTFRLRWLSRDDEGLPEALRRRPRPEETFVLSNDVVRAVFSDRGAAIKEMWLKQFSLDAERDPSQETWIPILRGGVRRVHRALTMGVAEPERYGIDPADATWQVTQARDRITFRLTAPEPRAWSFEKVVTLPQDGSYDLGVSIRVTTPSGIDPGRLRMRLVGPAGVYVEDVYRGIFGSTPPEGILLERRGGDDDSRRIDSIDDDGELTHIYELGSESGYLHAVGIRGAFFVCALVTEERFDGDRPAGDVTRAGVQLIELSEPVERDNGESSRQNMLGYVVCDLPFHGGSAKASFRLYAGPTDTASLRELKIDDAVDFGWFSVIGRFLMGLMKGLEGLVGSYGLAIMVMTLIVRAALFPISYRMQLGMQRYSRRIQKIKPILDELEKKYGSNRQKLNQERMRVMREHKIGFPLGCLTILLQFPIWIALFGALRVEFALRHQPFLWCADLSMPDHLFALPFWPSWLNLFPIIMLALWVAQQRFAPSPGTDDPQVRAQMKMVKFMPYVFFFMLYTYAAALAVYMCVSSAWGIVEGKLVRRAVARLDA